jgi:hypothetical protein
MSARPLILGTVALLLGTAPAARAQGVTNPAEHPAPITVTIDGHTYTDGRDTLPGYDDEACTPIPNVQYDFDDNQVQYYDSGGELLDTAHWTEWDRISSYQTWVAQHKSGTPTATPTAAPTSAATATPAPTSAATATPAPTRSAGRSPVTRHATSKSPSTKHAASPSTKDSSSDSTPAGDATSPSTSSSGAKHVSSSPAKQDKAAVPGSVAAAPSPTVAATGTPPPAGSSTPAPTAVPAKATKFKLASQTLGGPRDTRLAGAGILAALFALGCIGLVFGEFRHRVFGPHR